MPAVNSGLTHASLLGKQRQTVSPWRRKLGRSFSSRPAAVVHRSATATLLEGPTFGEDGKLRVVDVTAPAGEPKVFRVDVRTKTSRPL